MQRAREGDGRGLGRRQFLVLGLAGAAAPWVTEWGHAASLLAAEAIVEGAPSVGYLVDSEHLPRVDRLPWLQDGPRLAGARWTAVPAASLPAGEPVLAVHGIRVRVHGLIGGEGAAVDLPRRVELDVFVEPADATPGDPPLVFHAWRMEKRGELVEESPPVSFDLLVDHEDGLVLALRVAEEPTRLRRVIAGSRHAAPEERSHAVRLGLAGGEGPKLLRGIYLLGLRPGSFAEALSLDPESLPGQPGLAALVVSVDAVSIDAAEPEG